MLITKLQDIVGEENATDDRAICTSYSRDQHWHFVPAKNPAYVMRPGTKEEVRSVLMLANKHKIPVIPYSTGINVRGLTIPVHDGSILLDLSRMNRILEINPEMKTATVEPGVTFGMLLEQTRKHKLRPAFPDAPLTVSVLVNYYLRGIYQTSASDGHDHTISYEMLLPNGETLKTGSRALSEMPYFRYGVGPDFAGMFGAHPGTCGVVTELTAKLYRLYDNRKEYFIGFDDVGTPTKFIYNLMHDELAASIRLVDNQSWLEGIFGTFDYAYDKQFHRLVELGIYGWFRPYAGIIEPTAERIGYLAEVWKKFLRVLDPNEIMNRGKLF